MSTVPTAPSSQGSVLILGNSCYAALSAAHKELNDTLTPGKIAAALSLDGLAVYNRAKSGANASTVSIQLRSAIEDGLLSQDGTKLVVVGFGVNDASFPLSDWKASRNKHKQQHTCPEDFKRIMKDIASTISSRVAPDTPVAFMGPAPCNVPQLREEYRSSHSNGANRYYNQLASDTVSDIQRAKEEAKSQLKPGEVLSHVSHADFLFVDVIKALDNDLHSCGESKATGSEDCTATWNNPRWRRHAKCVTSSNVEQCRSPYPDSAYEAYLSDGQHPNYRGCDLTLNTLFKALSSYPHFQQSVASLCTDVDVQSNASAPA